MTIVSVCYLFTALVVILVEANTAALFAAANDERMSRAPLKGYPPMRQRLWSTLIVCLLVALCAETTLLWPRALPARAASPAIVTAASSTPSTGSSNSVTVMASGEVKVAPDMATVTFGVVLKRDSAQDAQTAVNRVVMAAVQHLHALGIPDQQIQTADIGLEPSYDNAGTVTGYQARQTLAVVVDGLGLVGRVVDAGVRAQANNNVSITFGLRDENAARTSALAQAVGIARTRATTAAQALGLSLSHAHVQLTEGSPSVPLPVTQSAVRVAPSQGAPTQTFGGTLTVHEDVTLTYTF